MAATYFIMNLAFLGAAIVVLAALRSLHFSKAILVTLVVLLVCTTVFDSLIILAGIVQYDLSKILGLYIGVAPVEDFFYALLSAALIPALWTLTTRRSRETR